MQKVLRILPIVCVRHGNNPFIVAQPSGTHAVGRSSSPERKIASPTQEVSTLEIGSRVKVYHSVHFFVTRIDKYQFGLELCDDSAQCCCEKGDVHLRLRIRVLIAHCRGRLAMLRSQDIEGHTRQAAIHGRLFEECACGILRQN